MEGKVLCVDCQHRIPSDVPSPEEPGAFDQCQAITSGGEISYVTGAAKPKNQSYCANSNRKGRCQKFVAKAGVPA